MLVARSAVDTAFMSKFVKSVPTTSAANNVKTNVPVITTSMPPKANACPVTLSVRVVRPRDLKTVCIAER